MIDPPNDQCAGDSAERLIVERSLIFELVCNLLVSLEINSHVPEGMPSSNADDIDDIYMSSIMAM